MVKLSKLSCLANNTFLVSTFCLNDDYEKNKIALQSPKS